MIKAVFIDIDDTLLTSNREITKETKDAIEKCIKKGIKIILASGRSRKEAIDYQKEFKTSPYIISSNGASCYDITENKEIYNESINKNIVLDLLKYSNENNYKIKLNYKDRLVLNQSFYPDEKDKELPKEELEKIAQKEEVVQCVVSNRELEKMQEFKKYLEENFTEIKIENESKRLKNPELKPSKNYYCDITSKKVSKGNAVKNICEYLKIDTNDIITIGDGENDISMFEVTPNSVAMENAVPQAKQKSKYQTLSNDENGVAIVLEKI